MKHSDDEIESIERTQTPVVFRMSTSEFQQEVLAKLGRLEAQMSMLIGNGQPGRMRLAEERITALEKNDIRRSVYDRLVNAGIAVGISAAITLHDHLGIR